MSPRSRGGRRDRRQVRGATPLLELPLHARSGAPRQAPLRTERCSVPRPRAEARQGPLHGQQELAMTHVEALAKELEQWLPDAQCHVTTPAEVSGGPMTVVSLQYALARAALAFARARVPDEEELARLASG